MVGEQDSKSSVKFGKTKPVSKPVAMSETAVTTPMAATPEPVAFDPTAVVPLAAPVAADPLFKKPATVAPLPLLPASPSVVAPASVPSSAATPVPTTTPATSPAPPVTSAEPVRSSNVTPLRKGNFMATMQDTANETVKTFTNNAETAVHTGKAAMEQVATRSREALEHGVKSLDDMTNLAKGNVEAMLASSKAATHGFEQIAQQVADYARKSFEETAAAARALTTVKTPNELMQLQNDFAKGQFDRAVHEMSKLSEAMVKMMGDVMEPVQNRAATATETMKSAGQSWTNKLSA